MRQNDHGVHAPDVHRLRARDLGAIRGAAARRALCGGEFEQRATRAAEGAQRRSLTPRETTHTVLRAMPSAPGEDAPRDR